VAQRSREYETASLGMPVLHATAGWAT
jgi:hypothetical protein